MVTSQQQSQCEEDGERVEEVPEEQSNQKWQNGERSEQERERRRVLEVVVRLLRSQHIQIVAGDEIPERRAKNRKVVWKSEYSTLNCHDDRRQGVDQQQRTLIRDQFPQLYFRQAKSTRPIVTC